MNKMKPSALIRVGMASMLTLGFASSLFYYNEINKKNEIVMTDELYNPSVYKEEVVELNLSTDKLNRTLSSDLSGKGESFAKYSIDLGVDPYLAVAIAMHETGCTWNCSYLAKTCNNVGGQKGSGCGEYQAFETLEDGIYGFILNIKNKYVDYGLMTADEMNPKYAEDPTWSSKVNNYIEKIKNN